MSTHSNRRNKERKSSPTSHRADVASEASVVGSQDREYDDDAVETTTGNIFEDLGLPDAQTRLAKAELSRSIRRFLADKGWKQREAAEVLGLAQSDVSDLVRGKLGRFSMERLHTLLVRLGADVRIEVGERSTLSTADRPSAHAVRENVQHESAPAYVVTSAAREGEKRWAYAPATAQAELPSVLRPKWRSAPDLAFGRATPAALTRIPVQLVASVAATEGGTAQVGPFVFEAGFRVGAVAVQNSNASSQFHEAA
jgi:predicted XRE-type DNA-binding protein